MGCFLTHSVVFGQETLLTSTNCIYSKIGGVAPVNIIMELLKTKMSAVFVLCLRSLSGKQISNEFARVSCEWCDYENFLYEIE